MQIDTGSDTTTPSSPLSSTPETQHGEFRSFALEGSEPQSPNASTDPELPPLTIHTRAEDTEESKNIAEVPDTANFSESDSLQGED